MNPFNYINYRKWIQINNKYMYNVLEVKYAHPSDEMLGVKPHFLGLGADLGNLCPFLSKAMRALTKLCFKRFVLSFDIKGSTK